jgi:phytoene/squalene synthetase
MRRCGLDVTLFDDLLSAFTQDVVTKRYQTWDDLLDYCRRSANPIGRLVLRIAGYRGRQLDEWSDAVCTALQLANFWQDLEIDWRKGRVYLPLSVVQASSADLQDLGRRRMSPVAARARRSRPGRARSSSLAGRSPTACTGDCAGSCARRGSAACAFSIDSSARDSTSFGAARSSA